MTNQYTVGGVKMGNQCSIPKENSNNPNTYIAHFVNFSPELLHVYGGNVWMKQNFWLVL